MKKIVVNVILIALALILAAASLTACKEEKKGSRNEGLTTTPQPESKPYRGEITFSGFKSFEKDDSNFNFVAAFNSEYPGVEVVSDELTQEEYFETLDERIENGTIGDVFVLDSARLAKYAEEGKILDLTPYLENLISFETFKRLNPSELLFKTAYESCLYKGEYYMSAVEYSHEFVFINYSVFEKAGLTAPSDKWTWDEFYEYAEKLSEVEGIKAAVALDYNDYAVWGAFARSRGDNLFTYDSFGNISNINLTESKVMEGINELADFAKNDYVSTVDIDTISGEDLAEYGMIVCDRADYERWSDYFDRMDANNKAEEKDESFIEYNWDLIHFPRFSGTGINEEGEEIEVTYYSIGAKSCGLAVLVRDDIEEEIENHYDMCATFALYSLEENAAVRYSGEGESVPAMKSVNDMKFWREYPVAGKNTSVFTLFNSNDYAAFITPYINYDSSLEFNVGDAISDYIENGTPLRDSLQKIQDAANSHM